MSLPKNFTAGERLFASDLNDNFEYLETEIGNAGPAFSTAGSDTVALDFAGDSIVTRSAAGNVTFTGTNYTAGRSATVRIVADGTDRDLTFPSNWKWVSLKPTSLTASETGILTVTCFGSADTDAVAAWAWSA